VIRCRFKLPNNLIEPDAMSGKPSVKAWSTPVIENKREKDSNKLIGYLSSRVSWPSLVTVPFTGDAAVCALTPDHN
jgi:hypothetical protein